MNTYIPVRRGVAIVLAAMLCFVLLCACSGQSPGAAVPSAPADDVSSSVSSVPASSQPGGPEEGNSEGDLAPVFDLPLLGGGNAKLEELRGRPVFINFFATWCGPCMAEMPDIQQIYEDYGDSIHMLCVDVGEEVGTVEAFYTSAGYTFPVVLDTAASLDEPYNLYGIPQTYILDAEGVIAFHVVGYSGYDTFAGELDALLQAQGAPLPGSDDMSEDGTDESLER